MTLQILTCLTLLVCFGSSAFQVVPQDPEILSRRPPVFRSFDRAKNESTISSPLFNPDDLPNMFDPSGLPPPDMRLHGVEYTYPGTIRSRPQAVVFIIVPSKKHKRAPNFSFAVDSAVVHEGEATLRDFCCVTVNGHTSSTQQFVVTVPTEIFERMAQAKKIELKLDSEKGKYSLKLNDYQRKCLAALASTMK